MTGETSEEQRASIPYPTALLHHLPRRIASPAGHSILRLCDIVVGEGR
jgi:hypothetical protein